MTHLGSGGILPSSGMAADGKWDGEGSAPAPPRSPEARAEEPSLSDPRAREAMRVLQQRFRFPESIAEVSAPSARPEESPPHWTRLPTTSEALLAADADPVPVTEGEPVPSSALSAASAVSDERVELPSLAEAALGARGLVETAGVAAEPTDGLTALPMPIEDEPEEGGAPVSTLPPESALGFETVDDARIPAGRDSFRIGEVAEIVGVKAHVLRFWETEFPHVAPEKSESGQRRYRRQDVAWLLQIKRLRHESQLTVAQARTSIRRALEEGTFPSSLPELAAAVDGPIPGASSIRQQLAELRRAVVDLLALAEGDETV